MSDSNTYTEEYNQSSMLKSEEDVVGTLEDPLHVLLFRNLPYKHRNGRLSYINIAGGRVLEEAGALDRLFNS